MTVKLYICFYFFIIDMLSFSSSVLLQIIPPKCLMMPSKILEMEDSVNVIIQTIVANIVPRTKGLKFIIL